VLPRLVRFYGGDPMMWLERLPIRIVRDFAEMLPRLQAEESLLTADRVALGAGTLKQDAARELGRRWERATRDPGARDSRARVKLTPGDLAAMGIRYKVVERTH
jgi:hypothetical protein